MPARCWGEAVLCVTGRQAPIQPPLASLSSTYSFIHYSICPIVHATDISTCCVANASLQYYMLLLLLLHMHPWQQCCGCARLTHPLQCRVPPALAGEAPGSPAAAAAAAPPGAPLPQARPRQQHPGRLAAVAPGAPAPGHSSRQQQQQQQQHMKHNLCKYVCVCVRLLERQTDRQTGTHTDRQAGGQAARQAHRQTGRGKAVLGGGVTVLGDLQLHCAVGINAVTAGTGMPQPTEGNPQGTLSKCSVQPACRIGQPVPTHSPVLLGSTPCSA